MARTPDITVLTDPVPYGLWRLPEYARSVARRILRAARPLPVHARSKYRGHFAVTRSVVEGLEKAGISYNYNPQKKRDIADTVVVLSGFRTLRQAIEWKCEGRIRRLLAGPNILVIPDPDSPLSAPEVDVCITPAKWVSDTYTQNCPALVGRCAEWAAGVDLTQWVPSGNEVRDNVVIYEKQPPGFREEVETYKGILRRHFRQVVAVHYGEYDQTSYRRILGKAKLLVGLSGHESQGIAWAEAWAMGVPTLIRRYDTTTIMGRRYKCSSAPYLSPPTGMFFQDVSHFDACLDAALCQYKQFQPRAWVVANMSDQVSCENLYNITRSTRNPKLSVRATQGS